MDAYCPGCGAGSIFNGMPGEVPCWLCSVCGHERTGQAAGPTHNEVNETASLVAGITQAYREHAAGEASDEHR